MSSLNVSWYFNNMSEAGSLTYLALRQEVGHQSPSDSILHIAVLKDDKWGFPPELQSHRLYTLGSHLHYL